MPIDLDAMAAAMDVGIAAASPANSNTPPEGNDNDDGADNTGETADTAASGAVDNDDTAGSDTGSTDGSGEGNAPADGSDDAAGDDTADAQSADGAADGETGADKSKGKKPDGAVQPADGEARKADPINDPLPNALKRETKDRINTLIGMVRENSTRAEKAESDFNTLYGAIQESTATPPQYKQALSYIADVNSNDPARQEKAYEFMLGELKALGQMLGKVTPGVNVLEGHQDLINAVGAGQITREAAQELAAARNQQQFMRQRAQHQTQQSQQQSQQQQAVSQGQQALNRVETELKASDPHYAAKKAILVPMLKPMLQKIHPSGWEAAFRQAYANLPATAVARSATAASTTVKPNGGGGQPPKNTPLRAGNPSGGGSASSVVAKPKSMAEAIEFGIKNAGR